MQALTDKNMNRTPFLFLATADEAWIARHKEALSQEFDLNIFRLGAECVAALADRQPDVLLLDTALTDVDAFAMHQAIRDDFNTSDVYQLLMCSEEEAGREDFVGNDFIIQPFSDRVLSQKLTLLKKALTRERIAKEQMSYAQNVAMTAMCSMGELGIVMEFLSKSFACQTIQAVGELALNAIKQYELDSIIHFTWEGESYTARTDGAAIDPVDREHIAQMRTLGRLLEIKEQLIVNFDHTTILIKQMPDDSARCGRIRDNIATLCEGVESRVLGLLLEQDNLLKQQGIRYAVCEIRDSVANLYERQVADLKSGRHLIDKVIDDFEDAFALLGVMPEVENQMISQLVTLRQRVTEIWSHPGEVDAKLRSVISSLGTLAGEVGADKP
jgi:DNA-binding response OmpR family regulator